MHRTVSIRAAAVTLSALVAQIIAWAVAVSWTPGELAGPAWWHHASRVIAAGLLTVAILTPSLVVILRVVPAGTPLAMPRPASTPPPALPPAPPRVVVDIRVEDLPRARTPLSRTPIGG